MASTAAERLSAETQPDARTQCKPAQARKMVRIARVITRMNIGGPAVHVTLATSKLERFGFETALITGSLAPGERCATDQISSLKDPPVAIPELVRDIALIKDFTALIRLVRYFRAYRPEIVHTHTSKAGALGRVAAWIAGVPVRVHTYHGLVLSEHFSERRSRLYARIERLLARLSTRLIAISPRQKQDLETSFRISAKNKIECIPLGLDVEPFLRQSAASQILRRKLGISPADPLLGWIGRLAPIKDPILLVEIMRRIVTSVPNCHAAVIGDGEMRRDLEAAIGRSGLKSNVHLAGWRTDLAEVCGDLDLVLVTSRNEGTPLVLLEIMACGKTFVAPAVGGIPDLVTGQAVERDGVKYFANGALTDRSADCMARGAVTLLQDADARGRMGRRAREFAAERFSADRLASDLDCLYRKLLQEVSPTVPIIEPRKAAGVGHTPEARREA